MCSVHRQHEELINPWSTKFFVRSPTAPNVPWRLAYLRRLLAEDDFVSDRIYRMDALRILETSTWIRATGLIGKDTVFRLTNLRNLGIYFGRTEKVEMVLGDLVSRLSHLRSKKMVMYRNQIHFQICNRFLCINIWWKKSYVERYGKMCVAFIITWGFYEEALSS